MTFTTLTYAGVEKPLADWSISQGTREVANQSHDHFACDMLVPADAADPIPFGSQITLRIGRSPLAFSLQPSALPPSGLTLFEGGKIFFVGYRVDEFREGSAASESLQFKFAGPWEFFFARTVFNKLWLTWSPAASAQIADWRSQVVLGQSATALIGPQNTVAGTSVTNLMSIRQQVAETINYCAWRSACWATGALVAYNPLGGFANAQFQSDVLTAADTTNYDLIGLSAAQLVTNGNKLIIPDFIPGYEASGKNSNTANLSTVLRAPLEAVNDIMCAEALTKQLRWLAPLGDAIPWFDYATTPPTLHISTRDAMAAVNLAI